MTRGQVRAALKRLRVRFDAPPPAPLGERQHEVDGPAGEDVDETPPRAPRRPSDEVGLAELISAGLIKPPLELTKRRSSAA